MGDGPSSAGQESSGQIWCEAYDELFRLLGGTTPEPPPCPTETAPTPQEVLDLFIALVDDPCDEECLQRVAQLVRDLPFYEELVEVLDEILTTSCQDELVDCAAGLIGSVDALVGTACDATAAPDGDLDTNGVPPGLTTCLVKVIGAVDLVLTTVCPSSSPATCARDLLDDIEDLTGDVCSSIDILIQHGELPAGWENLPDSLEECARRVMGVVELVMNSVCGSTDAEVCVDNLINRIDDLLWDVCSSAVLPSGDLDTTGDVPPGVTLCLVKLVGTVELVMTNVCDSTDAQTCVENLLNYIDDLMSTACTATDLSLRQGQSSYDSGGLPLGQECVTTILDLVEMGLRAACDYPDPEACSDGPVDRIGDLLADLCRSENEWDTDLGGELNECVEVLLAGISALIEGVCPGGLDWCGDWALAVIANLIQEWLNQDPLELAGATLLELTAEDCQSLWTESPWPTDVLDCMEYVEGTASDATPLGALSLYAMKLEDDIGMTAPIQALREEQLASLDALVDDLVLRNLEGTETSGASSAGYKLNDDEKEVCKNEPFDCWRARNAHTDAKEWAARKFGVGNGVDNKKDAYRHCMWSALMTVRANSDFARRMGFAHEEHEQTRAGRMDIHNNSVGRLAGRTNGDETDTNKNNRCMAYANSTVVQEGSPEYGLIWFGHGI